MFHKTVLSFFEKLELREERSRTIPLIKKLFLILFGNLQKKIEKNEKDSRKFNNNKTSLQTKQVCENPERISINKKQKTKKIYKDPGQSHCQFHSATAIDTKEPDQSNRWLSSTTVTDATIEESKNKICCFQKRFIDIKTEQIHNYYFCQQQNCRHISLQDLAAMSKEKKNSS